jgi:hypothetical protein
MYNIRAWLLTSYASTLCDHSFSVQHAHYTQFKRIYVTYIHITDKATHAHDDCRIHNFFYHGHVITVYAQLVLPHKMASCIMMQVQGKCARELAKE